MIDERLEALQQWLGGEVAVTPLRIEPASGDASFRRYFRVTLDDGATLIAMDAPPEKEDCAPFVQIANRLHALGLHVPAIHAQSLAQGFLLLEDLGSVHYLDRLDDASVDRLYGDALGALLVVQGCVPVEGLPDYDRAMLLREMALFPDWLLGRELGIDLMPDERTALDAVFEHLVDNALEQPRVCVLRDYHSRNLMVTASPNPGILDFQDAVAGPVTYDLVSLLKDCYIAWPRARVVDWVYGYHELATQSGVLREVDEARFLRWFDLMGVQRHLKAAGIFARLNRRDGKPGYLKDIPRTVDYIIGLEGGYPELGPVVEACRQVRQCLAG